MSWWRSSVKIVYIAQPRLVIVSTLIMVLIKGIIYIGLVYPHLYFLQERR